MQASEVRRYVLRDHEELRGMLLSLEEFARHVIGGERDFVEPLRLQGEALLARLRDHLQWEDSYLRPALLAVDPWGPARAERLDADHREQRALLEHELLCVRDGSRPAMLVARNLIDFAQLLREEMDDEEKAIVNADVLRDDIIGVDVEAG